MYHLIYFIAQTTVSGSGVTIEHVLIAGITAVAGALVFVYKDNKDSTRRCDEDRKKLWEALEKLSNQTCSLTDCVSRRTLTTHPGNGLPFAKQFPPPAQNA